jgi:hypothetical protein
MRTLVDDVYPDHEPGGQRYPVREPIARAEPPLSQGALSQTLCDSVLMQRGGCLLIDDLLGATLLTALCDEANERQNEARRTVWPGSRQVDWRGGDPARSYAGVTGGPVQSSIFASPDLAAHLSDLCGLPLRLAGVGSFSYYEAGDFLAVHRDILTCDITLLTCLLDTATGTPGRSPLRLYPAYARAPLTQLRATAAPTHVDIRLDRGQTAILLGGIVPHEVLPMTAHQRRTVSVICMTAVI